VGLLLGLVLRYFLHISAGVPIWATVLATLVSVAIGLTFGLFPANRAARMDPVEALRHE
jgi:putative ABC transport system permease protein